MTTLGLVRRLYVAWVGRLGAYFVEGASLQEVALGSLRIGGLLGHFEASFRANTGLVTVYYGVERLAKHLFRSLTGKERLRQLGECTGLLFYTI